jgi:hypothetical protein
MVPNPSEEIQMTEQDRITDMFAKLKSFSGESTFVPMKVQPANQYQSLVKAHPECHMVHFANWYADDASSPVGVEYDVNKDHIMALVEVRNCRDGDGIYHHRVHALTKK